MKVVDMTSLRTTIKNSALTYNLYNLSMVLGFGIVYFFKHTNCIVNATWVQMTIELIFDENSSVFEVKRFLMPSYTNGKLNLTRKLNPCTINLYDNEIEFVWHTA